MLRLLLYCEMPGLEESEAMDHRLYHLEVLSFGPDVSMIVVLPPPDQICTGPGQKDETPFSHISLPIYVFEMRTSYLLSLSLALLRNLTLIKSS